ncbi:asparagine synthase (glutamine-hydrolyzing) [Streptomyces oceani]|uniref:asparagine synthase (glutamine-hydrolyzing) n=1 Tax=Streptomyces oceani TaxID=1075402 RepID=A0A1E7KNX1_9ACTN|nr:asparagine synthase (glutamine-hydrolyzing) [Streptomyces oceani]OEV05584.1 asparagine synthase [Streptomyces oceani]
MCRIFGSFATATTESELAVVSARQRHGGPDAQGLCVGPDWSLGCDRLAVTDPDGGRQPYRLSAGPEAHGIPGAPGIVAVFNGELYNHHELRRRLAGRGHTFPDRCDGTLLPALYAEYGLGFAEHLEGMYAVALLDLRDRARLVLATDDLGMKPLYHHQAPDGAVHFASELPALLAFDGVPVDPRPEALDEYLTTRACMGERTALRGIAVLPPGTTAVAVGRDGLRTHHRRAFATHTEPDRRDLRTPGAGLRRTLRREVHRLARADRPVCVVTSGGLDSGLVTALAAEQARVAGSLPVHSYHLTYRGRWPHSEHGYARAVARRCGTVHHQVEAEPARFPSLLQRTVRHLGQPNADPITLSSLVLYEAIGRAGFAVTLTGDGADEFFGGYDRVRAAVAAPPGSDWAEPYVEALAAVPRSLRERLYTPEFHTLLRERQATADRIVAGLRADATRNQLDQRRQKHQRHMCERRARLDALTRFETTRRLPGYHLRRTDHLSMAAGVEARLPFCQPAVTAWSSALPVAGREGKRALYAAGRGLLPDSVLRRSKQPFTLPVAAMLGPGQPLLDLARDVLTPARLRADGRLSSRHVSTLLDRQTRRPAPGTATAVWALLVHQLWQEQLAELASGSPGHGGVPEQAAA